MTIATTLGTGYSRTVLLHENADYQTCETIDIGDVPEMPASAVVGKVTPRSIRYDDGVHAWFVDPRDKTVIRAYRERRNEEDIKAGAFPTRIMFYDEKGPL